MSLDLNIIRNETNLISKISIKSKNLCQETNTIINSESFKSLRITCLALQKIQNTLNRSIKILLTLLEYLIMSTFFKRL